MRRSQFSAEEGVIEDLGLCEALLGKFAEQPCDETTAVLITHKVRKIRSRGEHFLIETVGTGVHERCLPREHFVE